MANQGQGRRRAGISRGTAARRLTMEITIDTKGLEAAVRALAKVRGGLGKALERTLNRAGEGMRTDTDREIRAVYQVTRKFVLRNLILHKASAKAGRLEVKVQAVGAKLPLIAFKTRPANPPTRPPKAGTLVSVRKDKGGKRIKHGFVARMESGHVGVFEREVVGGKRVGRLKIIELRGPSVKGMLRHEVMQRGTVLDRAKERADKRLGHEVKQVLRQAGFRG